MASKEQQDRESTGKVNEVPDLSAPKLEAEKEEQVKGGKIRQRPVHDEM